jgi:hypothetical protein
MVLGVGAALTAMALFFFGLAFIALGMMGLGKGKADGAGTVFYFVGIINGILGFVLLALSLNGFISGTLHEGIAAGNIATAFLVMIFAFTWLAAGIINMRGYDLMPLGNACILMGLFMFVYAAIFAQSSAWWLLIDVLSWAWAFWSVTLASHGKIGLKIVGWTFLIQAFYTLWIPAAILLLGMPLP